MYDLAIIGAGWSGFNAALRAKEYGLKTCLIEKDKTGGTCLNYGCIPTKTLLQSAKAFLLAKKSEVFGIHTLNPEIDFAKVQQRKERIISDLLLGMQFMLKGVDFFNAPAEFVSRQGLRVGGETISAKFILIATGSRPTELSCLKFDSKKILSSNDILNLKEVPDSLLIVGGGVIGCEFASLFSAFLSEFLI